MPVPYTIRYDRRVSTEFLSQFTTDSVLGRLRLIAEQAALPVDLQMRKDPRTKRQWASLYAGLTSVLDVVDAKGGIRLRAHKTWSADSSYGFQAEWGQPMSPTELEAAWSTIELYLERVLPAAVRKHGMTEGLVQAVTSKKSTGDWAILDREVTPSFSDAETKKQILAQCRGSLLAATRSARDSLSDISLPAPPATFGTECDLLAVDGAGRVLAIEVKPAAAGTIAWVPAQAAMYARVLQYWVDHDALSATDDVSPSTVISDTLAQRQMLGHSIGFEASLPTKLTVTPVVVLQKGALPARLDQMRAVRDHLATTLPDTPPVQVFEVSLLGDFGLLD